LETKPNLVMLQEHLPGEKMLVAWAGDKDPDLRLLVLEGSAVLSPGMYDVQCPCLGGEKKPLWCHQGCHHKSMHRLSEHRRMVHIQTAGRCGNSIRCSKVRNQLRAAAATLYRTFGYRTFGPRLCRFRPAAPSLCGNRLSPAVVGGLSLF
jgi:hypothetical protein